MDRDSTRVQKASRRCRIEVILPQTRRYMRGCGPALAPLRIALKNDSTAYITGKEVWPTTTKHGGLKLQLHYLVQWTDLPAASVLIQAHNILNYVSPRILEDYEYKLLLERDAAEEEHKKRLEEAKRAANELKSKSLCATTTATSTCTGTSNTPSAGLKKRGRPKKTDVSMRKSIKGKTQDASSLLTNGVKGFGPSLSTPQKALGMVADELALDGDAEDENETGDDDIFQHLYGDFTTSHAQFENHSRNFSPSTESPRQFVARIPSAGRITIPLHHNAQRTKEVTSAGGFTPAARSRGRWPTPLSPHQPAKSPQQPSPPEKAPTSLQQRKPKESGKSRNPMKEAVWVVERLEGDTILDINGEMQRCFQVRWEGDWPPEQNPTWEPESNLPKKLVREYLKKAANKTVKVKSAKKPPRKSLTRKYSSVAEAFEGDMEDPVRDPTPFDDGNDVEMEERLFVEERERIAEPVRPPPSAANLNFVGVRSFTAFNGSANEYGQHGTNLNPNL